MAEHGGHGEGNGQTGKPRDAPFRIFLSYRREDAPVHVGRLWDALRGAHARGGFPKSAIFKDVDTIKPGEDFRQAIGNAVQASDVFLAVIGPHWLSVANEQGVPRLDDPRDYVRTEIEAALQRAAEHNDVRVVPIRVGGAAMPGVRDLPEALQDLAHRHAVELTDAHWDYDVDQLLSWLKELAEGRRRPRWRRIALVAAAAILVAALAIAVVQLTGSPGDPALDGREPANDALAWERVRDDTTLRMPERQVMTSIVDREESGPRYVVGGFDDSQDDRDAAIWTSDDGERWDRVPLEERLGDQEITNLTKSPSGEGLLAVGTDNASGDNDIAVWQSEDGRQWTAKPPVVEDGTDEVVYRVTKIGKTGLFGAGWRKRDGDDDASVWKFDPDGTVVPSPDDHLGGQGTQHINRILKAPGSSRTLVGVGVDVDDAAVWLSNDEGETWERTMDSTLSGDGRQDIYDALNDGTQIIAVGLEQVDGETRGVVWRTHDAKTWTRVDTIDEDSPVELRRVFELPAAAAPSDEPTFLAAGLAGGTAAVWTSRDGTQWHRDPDPSGALDGDTTELRSIRAGEFPLIAVGSSGREDDQDAAVWLGKQPA